MARVPENKYYIKVLHEVKNVGTQGIRISFLKAND
jgi:hypothetical protein